MTRYFLYEHTLNAFTEVSLDHEVEVTDDRCFVVATPAGENGVWRLVAEDYAGPCGAFALQISQPLPVALAIFGAALAASDAHQDGALTLPAVAA